MVRVKFIDTGIELYSMTDYEVVFASHAGGQNPGSMQPEMEEERKTTKNKLEVTSKC